MAVVLVTVVYSAVAHLARGVVGAAGKKVVVGSLDRVAIEAAKRGVGGEVTVVAGVRVKEEGVRVMDSMVAVAAMATVAGVMAAAAIWEVVGGEQAAVAVKMEGVMVTGEVHMALVRAAGAVLVRAGAATTAKAAEKASKMEVEATYRKVAMPRQENTEMELLKGRCNYWFLR